MKTYKHTWICAFLLPALFGLIISSDSGEPTENPFHRFQGEWVMKDGIFETYFDGVYSENVDTSRLLIAKSNTDFDILWHIDIVSSHGIMFWTYDNIRNEVHHLSSNSSGNMAAGKGAFSDNGDLSIKIVHEDACDTCFRMYNFEFISEDEIFYRSVQYKGQKETGDYYGGIFVRRDF